MGSCLEGAELCADSSHMGGSPSGWWELLGDSPSRAAVQSCTSLSRRLEEERGTEDGQGVLAAPLGQSCLVDRFWELAQPQPGPFAIPPCSGGPSAPFWARCPGSGARPQAPLQTVLLWYLLYMPAPQRALSPAHLKKLLPPPSPHCLPRYLFNFLQRIYPLWRVSFLMV